jgi:DinB superfamily
MDRNKIETYARGGEELVKAFRGLTLEQLHFRPIDRSWTLHQNAIHMMDSDLIGADRMKRIACMDNPLLCGYDETAFNTLPGVSQLDAIAACDIFQKNREMTATILRALPDATFLRSGIHTESGKVTLEQMIDKYIEHLRHHLVIIAKKRKMASGPVPALASPVVPATPIDPAT